MKIRPIILSGGSGTRLWPVSRKRHPKQFADLIGPHSLLMRALEMLRGSADFAAPTIVGNGDHKFFILDVLTRTQQINPTILLEPCGRNTAAAAITAALAEEDDEVLHLLLPSDHIIGNQEAFFKAIHKAAPAARAGHLALFGIEPTFPATGYGYIQRRGPTPWPDVEAIAKFNEKPDAQGATAFIAQGALWNSGIFLYNPTALLQEAAMLAPDQLTLCREALLQSRIDFGCRMLQSAAYEKLKDISFDYLVMEHTKKSVVVPTSMGWSDVGSWQAVWQLEDKDEEGNVVKGPVALLDVTNSYIRSDAVTLGVIGLKDIAIVATKDAVLVMPRERSQEVKKLVQLLEQQRRNVATDHCRVLRPWGSYEGVAHGARFQVKHIIISPGKSLSLQMHHHRAEHWIVVAGTAAVECDDIKKNVYENESIFIPMGAKHRLGNPGKVDLHLVEVQSGDYLGEDDIVRFSDMFGRVS